MRRATVVWLTRSALAGRKRAAVVGDGEEIAEVVPVEHAITLSARRSARAFCNNAERYHNIVAIGSESGIDWTVAPELSGLGKGETT